MNIEAGSVDLSSAGVSRPELTVQSVADCWRKVVSDNLDAILRAGDFDPREWDIKSYRQ